MSNLGVTEFEYCEALYVRRDLVGLGSLFIVDRDYSFRYRLDGIEKRQKVPADFPTDFASIPWFARWLISKIGSHSEAAVIHDWHYRAKVVPRKEADHVFLIAMKVAHTPWWQRTLMFTTVRLFARRFYGRAPRKIDAPGS